MEIGVQCDPDLMETGVQSNSEGFDVEIQTSTDIVEVEVQTNPDLIDIASQTIPNTNEVEIQTSSNLIDIASQTIPNTNDVGVQSSFVGISDDLAISLYEYLQNMRQWTTNVHNIGVEPIVEPTVVESVTRTASHSSSVLVSPTAVSEAALPIVSHNDPYAISQLQNLNEVIPTDPSTISTAIETVANIVNNFT